MFYSSTYHGIENFSTLKCDSNQIKITKIKIEIILQKTFY
jgi:hypothetical protein